MQYGLAQAKARLSELTLLVDAGQEVVIAKHGKPGYKLVAIAAAPAGRFDQNAVETPPASLDDMAELLAGLRSQSRMPSEPDFVAQWPGGARYQAPVMDANLFYIDTSVAVALLTLEASSPVGCNAFSGV